MNLRARAARYRPSRLLVFDLFTSYGVNFARAAAMLAIVALLGHRTTTGYLAAFLFLRAMIGLLNNLFAGAQPAALAALRLGKNETPGATASVLRSRGTDSSAESQSDILQRTTASEYASRGTQMRVVATDRRGFDGLFVGSLFPAIVMFAVAFVCVPFLLDALRNVLPPSRDWTVAAFTLPFAAGLLFRLQSDTAGAVLQMRKLLWLDNLLVAFAELWWAASAYCFTEDRHYRSIFVNIGEVYLKTGLVLWLVRWLIAATLLVDPKVFSLHFRFDIAKRFLLVASILAVASLGDFLYAPANNLIINRLLDPILIASYGPALQVDALLLLGVSGLASVLLPRVVALHQRNDFAALRRAYLAAHIVGTLLLLGGAGLFLTFSGPLLRLWLGDVPPGVQAILPFVLIHTVVGGTASVGRSVLLGVGNFRAWTITSLAGGVANVVLGLFFVVVCGWGLRGIVAATIVTVTLRNAIWLPWYVLRQLRAPAP